MKRTPAALIARKRDALEHSPEEIHTLIEQFMSGHLADYQMSAWLMAAYLNGLSDAEMTALTEAMLHSGTRLHHESGGAPLVDKHSTGGVGDKLSLPLAPLASSCGLVVPMISGRGLGHTGGTLDKLESIPGYRVRLSRRQVSTVLRKNGASINGQTKDIAPADRRIYALRDVTGTVACRPLIVASILSKKLAAGLDGLVLDVKVGRGAFMKTKKDALKLARSLIHVSTELGTPATALMTAMDAPLGRTIGHALEVREAIDILQGQGPPDTTELVLRLGVEMLLLGRLHSSRGAARKKLLAELESGRAYERFVRMVSLHGGDVGVIETPHLLPRAPQQQAIKADKSGFITAIDSLELAHVALHLGAGRLRAEDPIDPAVGIELHAGVGDRVRRGDRLATLHLRKKSAEAEEATRRAFSLSRTRPTPRPLILRRLSPDQG